MAKEDRDSCAESPTTDDEPDRSPSSSSSSSLPPSFAEKQKTVSVPADLHQRARLAVPPRPTLKTIHSSDKSRFMTLKRLQEDMDFKPMSRDTGTPLHPPQNTTQPPSSQHPHPLDPQQQQQHQSHSQQQGLQQSDDPQRHSGQNQQSHNQPTQQQPHQQQQQQERQLTIETAVFPEQEPMFNTNSKKNTSNDARSIRSGSESGVQRPSNNSNSNSKRAPKKNRRKHIKPTEIFAHNLSAAVLDANDSDEQESFVYHRPYAYPTVFPSFKRASDVLPSYTKPRRPVLRSAVSELPPTAMLRSPFHQQQQQQLQQQHSAPPHRYKHLSDIYPVSDEENLPLLRAPPLKKRVRRYWSDDLVIDRKKKNTRPLVVVLWMFLSCLAAVLLLWLSILYMALPLASVDVLELSNVLGSTKELFFDLHVKGRNGNLWTLQIQEASLSVFASSQYVPTSALPDNETLPFPSANPLEFLGTVYQLDEPLVFPPAHFFHSSIHEAISQVQIKNPGKTKNDMSGNERWSYLIRYPYELTVRGVLKYQVLPFPFHTQVHSARVCHVSRIDPATGEISNAIEQTTCDDGIDVVM